MKKIISNFLKKIISSTIIHVKNKIGFFYILSCIWKCFFRFNQYIPNYRVIRVTDV